MLTSLVTKILSGIATLVAFLGLGMLLQKQRQKTKELKDYKKTREILDEVHINTDRKSSVDRLRKGGYVRPTKRPTDSK
jgi:hypothetical protein